MWIRQASQYFESAEATVGLPNIILGASIVPELLQHDFTPRQLAIETAELLANPSRVALMSRRLAELPTLLGSAGSTLRIAQDLVALWRAESA
jgi:lipid-A-disaccharide synthase